MSAIKLAILGLGRAGWGMHTNEIADRTDKFQIVAACDVFPDRVAKMVERYEGCKGYTDIPALLADPDVEVVSIATPSTFHVDHACAALEAGKIVYLEKPVALTTADAKRLIATSQRTGVAVYFRHNRRYEPPYQHVREIMASGLLGDVFAIKLRRNGFQFRGDWQTLISCGGGQLNNWGPHIIDHGLRMLESPLKDMWSDLKLVAALGDAEDHLKVLLRGENGRVVDLEISGGSAISEPQYMVSGSRGALTLQGNTITLKYLDPDVALELGEASPEAPSMTGSFGSDFKPTWIEKEIPVAPKIECSMTILWDFLYDTVRNGKPFPITNEEALSVVDVTERVRKASPIYAGK